jgi:hypothetical protein
MRARVFLPILLAVLIFGRPSSLLAGTGKDPSQSSTMILEIDARCGPWDWKKGGLNRYYAYGKRHEPPVVFKGRDGQGLLPGQILSISYVKGRCRAWDPGYDNTNGPEGYLKTDASSYTGNSGEKLPSMFVRPDEWPTYIMALIGVFTDAGGNIVGFPFEIGEQRTVSVPGGATQLQFGLNDDFFVDNSGSFEISIVDLPRPAPPSQIFNGP